VHVLKKLLEGVVVEGKRVHRIDIELVVEIDPTVFQVVVAAAFKVWPLFTPFMVVAVFTDQWKFSFFWRLKQRVLIRHVAWPLDQPLFQQFVCH
jgi:hypothetical protein